MDHEELDLLRRYLRGEATPKEENYIRQWLITHEADENVRRLLQEEWMLTSADNELNHDMDVEWRAFKQKVSHPRRTEHVKEATRSKRFLLWSPLTLMTVSVIAVLLSSVFLYFLFQNTDPAVPATQEEVAYTIKKTNRGEKLNVTLPDGSSIKLNSSSELRIPDDYNAGKERVVFLNGEAFFEVVRDENKPFKVISGKVTTQVLGTSFNVNTLSPSEEVSVAVVTGKVRVANIEKEIILYPEEMTTVGASTVNPSKKTFDMDLVTGWRNNLLIFEKASLEEIIDKMEQWYGVTFVIEGKPHSRGKYSGRFENKSLSLVLEGLGFSSEFEYRIDGKTVHLKFK